MIQLQAKNKRPSLSRTKSAVALFHKMTALPKKNFSKGESIKEFYYLKPIDL